MKRIALLSLADAHGEAPPIDYRLLIESAIKVPLDRQNGATIDEMRRGIRVLDALDRAIGDAPLELEDADWEHLVAKVEHMPWGSVDRRFVRFHDDVLEATDAPRVPAGANGVAA